MKKIILGVVPFGLTLLLLSVISCGATAESAQTITKIESRRLPPSGSANVFFQVNGNISNTRVPSPYSFFSSYSFVANVTVSGIVNDMVDSGIYFSPARSSSGVLLIYDELENDKLVLDYTSGELWTEYEDGTRSSYSFGQLTRSNYKNFDSWSSNDTEIIELNRTLTARNQRALRSGDEVNVDFVIIYSALNGAYTQLFHRKSYTLA